MSESAIANAEWDSDHFEFATRSPFIVAARFEGLRLRAVLFVRVVLGIANDDSSYDVRVEGTSTPEAGAYELRLDERGLGAAACIEAERPFVGEAPTSVGEAPTRRIP